MTSSYPGNTRGIARRTDRRASRVRRAASLLAIAGACAFGASQAAAQERAVAELQDTVECSASTHLGYEVEYAAEIGSFAVVAMSVRSHAPQCLGRDMTVILADAEGRPLAVGSLALVEGAQVRFDTEAPVDAREVAALQMVAGRGA